MANDPARLSEGQAVLQRTARTSALRSHWALALALALALVGHLAWAAAEPEPALFEDEPHYNHYAYEDARAGDTSLLPGRLRFDQRPELISRVWAQLVTRSDMERFAPSEERFDPGLVRRARWINLACLLGTIGALYAQARALELGRTGRATAVLLLAAFPWFGFYVHTLWAEMLHALLAGLAFAGLTVHLARGARWALPSAGLAAGAAVLAKGTLNLFLPVACAVLAIGGLQRARAATPVGKLVAVVLPPLLFAGGVALVVVPQVVANAEAGHGWRLAGNRWKNLEMGLVLEPRELQEDDERKMRDGLHRTYMNSGPDYEEREAVARQRVFEHLEQYGFAAVLARQARKLTLLAFSTPSFFERALGERWGDPPPVWLEALRLPGRVVWYSLLAGGLGGLVLLGWRSTGWLFLALFALYYLAALLTIPYKERFVVPLVPTLCLFAGGCVELLRERRARAGPVLAACALLALSGCTPGRPDEPRKPNIVLVLSDDHAVGALGCYGSSFARTPNLDRLAAQGMRFTNAFCATALCGPARASILTGVHSHVHGVVDNAREAPLMLPTFPEALRAAGYHTAMFGKWHLDGQPTGFDHWEVLLGQGTYYRALTLRPEGERLLAGHVTDALTDLALDWLEHGRDAQRPFFLLLSHKAPHRPWQAAVGDFASHDGAELPLPATLFDDHVSRTPAAAQVGARIASDLNYRDLQLWPPLELDGWSRNEWDVAYAQRNAEFHAASLRGDALTAWRCQRFLESYLRCVAGVDRSVGAVHDWLERTGLARDTVMIYTSDHGAFLGDHGWFGKGWMYEEAMRLPLIVSWAGVIAAGTSDEHLVQTIDLAPTLCELAGAEGLEAAQGVSLLPLLRGEAPAAWRSAIYYRLSEVPASESVPPHFGVRTARHKLIRIPSLDAWELYDLERDPQELTNLAGDPAHSDTRRDLERELARLREYYGDPGG